MLAHSLLSVRCCLLKKYKSFLKVVDWTLYWLILNNTVLTLGLRPPPPKRKKKHDRGIPGIKTPTTVFTI